MRLFDYLVSLPGKQVADEDLGQDAWVNALHYLRERGEDVPDAGTQEELAQNYQPRAALVGHAYKLAKLHARDAHVKFTAAHVQDETVLDELAEDDVSFSDIEMRDVLEQRIAQMTPDQQKIIYRFIGVWIDQEKGMPISDARRKQLSRDRKLSNLPLVLKYGGYTKE